MRKRIKPRLVRFNAAPPQLLITRAVVAAPTPAMTIKLAISALVMIHHRDRR
jgi:hypothetical protein